MVPTLGTPFLDVKSSLPEELSEEMHNEISMLASEDDANKRWWHNATGPYKVEKQPMIAKVCKCKNSPCHILNVDFYLNEGLYGDRKDWHI